jgi:hypothetical protein
MARMARLTIPPTIPPTIAPAGIGFAAVEPPELSPFSMESRRRKSMVNRLDELAVFTVKLNL